MGRIIWENFGWRCVKRLKNKIHNLTMKKQNGYGLIILLISIAIIALVFAGAYYKVETKDDTTSNELNKNSTPGKSILENQLNAVKKAEEAKKMLEERDRNLFNI